MVVISRETNDIITGIVFLLFGLYGLLLLLTMLFGSQIDLISTDDSLFFIYVVSFQIFSIFLLEGAYSLFTHSYNPKKINYYVWILIVLLISISSSAIPLIIYGIYKLVVKVEEKKKKKKKANKKNLSVILLVVGLIFMFFIFYFLTSVLSPTEVDASQVEDSNSNLDIGSSNTPIITEEVDDTEEEDTKEDTQSDYVFYSGDGFTLYYPSDWYEGSSDDELFFISKFEGDDYAIIYITRDEAYNMSMAEIVDMYLNIEYDPDEMTIINLDHGIDNETGWGYVVYDIYFGDNYQRGKEVFVKTDSYIYTIQFSSSLAIFNETSKDFDSILDTIEFNE